MTEKFFELIEKFYLNKILEKYPHEVSSGEAQRTALIRSLVNNPKLLLLDEPFSNLNKGLREELQEILRDIIKRKISASLLPMTMMRHFILEICVEF